MRVRVVVMSMGMLLAGCQLVFPYDPGRTTCARPTLRTVNPDLITVLVDVASPTSMIVDGAERVHLTATTENGRGVQRCDRGEILDPRGEINVSDILERPRTWADSAGFHMYGEDIFGTIFKADLESGSPDFVWNAQPFLFKPSQFGSGVPHVASVSRDGSRLLVEVEADNVPTKLIELDVSPTGDVTETAQDATTAIEAFGASHAWMTEDGCRIFFDHPVDDQHDIYFSDRADDGLFQEPMPLIQGATDDMWPALSADETLLYFTRFVDLPPDPTFRLFSARVQ